MPDRSDDPSPPPCGRGGQPPSKSDEKVIQALAKPQRLELLARLEQDSASPEMIRDETGMTLESIAYDLKILLDAGCVEIGESRPIGGTVENYYRATPDVFFNPVFSAMAGMIDIRDNTVLNWTRVEVDEFGLVQISELMRSARAQVMLIQEQSEQRQEIHEKELIPLIVGVAAAQTSNLAPPETGPDSSSGPSA